MNRAFPTLARLPLVLPIFLVVALLSPAAHAENELYAGVGVGYSTYSIDDINFEGANFASRQFVGYTYGDYVGVEAGYINFGTVNDTVLVAPGEALNDGVKTWGYNLSLVGRYPLNDELHAIAKVGMVRWDSKATLEGSSLPVKTDGDDLIWGAGLDFRGSNRFHFRIEGEFVNIEFADSWWVLTTSVMYSFPLGR